MNESFFVLPTHISMTQKKTPFTERTVVFQCLYFCYCHGESLRSRTESAVFKVFL